MRTSQEFADEFFRLSTLLDQSLNWVKQKVHEYAQAERDYRVAQATAWQMAPRYRDDMKLTAGEREAWVNGETADLRQTRDTADGLRQAGLEAVRSRRAQISALQTLLNAHQEEARFVRMGPS